MTERWAVTHAETLRNKVPDLTPEQIAKVLIALSTTDCTWYDSDLADVAYMLDDRAGDPSPGT